MIRLVIGFYVGMWRLAVNLLDLDSRHVAAERIADWTDGTD